MAYTPAGLKRLVEVRDGETPQIWIYTSADVHTDVDATDYFANAEIQGMRVGDIVYVVESDNGYVATLHAVSAIDASGNATVSAAVLV